MKIFYLHGFGSDGNTDTAKEIRKSGYPTLLSPTYDPLTPGKSLNQLEKLLDPKDRNIIIASSLGGWYAERLSERVKNVELYLYNPSTYPAITLAKFDVDKKILYEYARLQQVGDTSVKTPVTLFLAIEDEVIQFRIARDHYTEKARSGEVKLSMVMTSGGHRMGNNVSLVVKTIDKNL
jgi:predicted esterase YcpF (UPF0227 family)